MPVLLPLLFYYDMEFSLTLYRELVQTTMNEVPVTSIIDSWRAKNSMSYIILYFYSNKLTRFVNDVSNENGCQTSVNAQYYPYEATMITTLTERISVAFSV